MREVLAILVIVLLLWDPCPHNGSVNINAPLQGGVSGFSPEYGDMVNRNETVGGMHPDNGGVINRN